MPRIVAEDSTITFEFNTRQFSTGAPFTLAGTPSMAVRVNGGATEITAGITLTADFDSKTGVNKVEIDLSASASYSAGAFCEVFIAAGTVDSVSVVGAKVYEFQIGTTESLDAAITRITAIEADTQDIQSRLPAALTADGNIKADTLRVGGTLQTAGDLAVLLADIPTVAEFDARTLVAANYGTAANQSSLITTIGVAGAGLTAVPWNSSWDAEAQSECADALTAASLNAAGIRAALGLASANLDTQIATLATAAALTAVEGKIDTIDGIVDAIKVITDALGATAAARLAMTMLGAIPGTVDDSAHSPTTTEFEADNITEATGDHFKDRHIVFISGALAGQETTISVYALSGANGHFTVVAMTEAPADGDQFVIV